MGIKLATKAFENMGFSTNLRDENSFEEVFWAMTVWSKTEEPNHPLVFDANGEIIHDFNKINEYIRDGGAVFVLEDGDIERARVTMVTKDGASDAFEVNKDEFIEVIQAEFSAEWDVNEPTGIERYLNSVFDFAFPEVEAFEQQEAEKKTNAEKKNQLIITFLLSISEIQAQNRTAIVGTASQSDARLFEEQRSRLLQNKQDAAQNSPQKELDEFINHDVSEKADEFIADMNNKKDAKELMARAKELVDKKIGDAVNSELMDKAGEVANEILKKAGKEPQEKSSIEISDDIKKALKEARKKIDAMPEEVFGRKAEKTDKSGPEL